MLIAVLAATLAACSAPLGPVTGPPERSSVRDEIRTGVGVTADTISLGVLTDRSGPFAAGGTAITNAAQMYVDEVNAAGGICGRRIRLEVRDHGYDVDKAIAAYAELEPQVLGFEQILGASPTSALLTNIASDKVLTAPGAWASTLLTNPNIALMGTTYDIESVNALDYLVRKEGLRAGDTIGHIYLDGEFGRNSLLGSTYAAGALGMTVRQVKVAVTDTDLSEQVATLRAARVKAVILSVVPQQTASAIGAATRLGLNVPFIGSLPAFSPGLLKTPVGPALREHFRMVSSAAPFSTDLPQVKQVAAAYLAAYPDSPPDLNVIYGYGVAKAYLAVLEKACADKDLTREGVAAAFRSTTDIDTGGLLPRLDFSRRGASPAREVYVSRPDPAVPGGLAVVELLFASDAAKAYRTPSES